MINDRFGSNFAARAHRWDGRQLVRPSVAELFILHAEATFRLMTGRRFWPFHFFLLIFLGQTTVSISAPHTTPAPRRRRFLSAFFFIGIWLARFNHSSIRRRYDVLAPASRRNGPWLVMETCRVPTLSDLFFLAATRRCPSAITSASASVSSISAAAPSNNLAWKWAANAVSEKRMGSA